MSKERCDRCRARASIDQMRFALVPPKGYEDAFLEGRFKAPQRLSEGRAQGWRLCGWCPSCSELSLKQRYAESKP